MQAYNTISSAFSNYFIEIEFLISYAVVSTGLSGSSNGSLFLYDMIYAQISIMNSPCLYFCEAIDMCILYTCVQF